MKQPSKGFGKQHRRLRRALLAGLLLLPLVLADRGFALDPTKDLKQYNCRTWNRRAGLPATSINAIAQTRDGYLWFGTSAGLLRFDGTEFKVLDLHAVAALRTSYVTSLASARSGGLWVGLEHSAFGFYDGQTFSFRGSNVVAMDVQSLLEGRNGTLWLAAQQEAVRLNPSGELETILPSAAFTNTIANAKCVYEDREGRVWFGTLTQGAFYWQDGKITKLPAPELEATTVLCITEDLAGQIWIGTGNGLYCYDASSLKRRETPPLQSEVRVLLVDRHGVLWIGTSWIGLARYLNGRYDYFLKTDGLDNETVQALYEDSEGSLWIGTGGGLDQLSDVKFPIQPATDDPKITDANSVTAARNGGVWIASYGGVRLFDPRTKTYTNGPGLPDSFTKRVFEARNGDLYFVCGITNLVVSSGGKIVATNGAPDLVVAMAEDDQGVVVSVAGNLYRAGTNYFQPYTFKTNVPPDFYWISNLASGRDGVIWVACGNGIFRIKDGVWQHWSGPEGLADANVQTVSEDQDGVLWAGLFSGIARLKDNQIRLISRKDGLFDNNIYAIVPDDLGNLWVDSTRGIYRVARRDINAFADGKTNHVACTVFDGIDSVKTTDKTAQERVGCKTADGRIWFPGPLGVVMIDPAHVPASPVAPPVHIERVLADGREVARNANTVVPPGNGELEFHFNALSFSAPSKVQIRYQLEGYDQDWVDAGDRRLAFYTNLKPGAYTFQVIAANADGVWNEQGDTVAISLRPHYYETAWFRLLCGGLAFAALIGIYLLRVQRLNLKQQALQKNRDLLESEIQKRTAELAKTNAALQEKIAERKQAEMALLESQALYQSLVSQVPAGLFRKDREGRYVVANPVFCQLKGLSAEEILGKTPQELDDYERARETAGLLKQPPRQRMLAAQGEEHHKRIVRTGETIEVEEAYPQPDGTVEYFHAVKAPVFDALGMVIGSQGMQFDITERRRMEEKLKLFRALIEGSNDAIQVVDPATGRFLDVNESSCRVLGYTRDEHLALTIFDVTLEVDRALFDATLARMRKTGQATVEALHRRKDGTKFPVEVSLSPITIDREYLLAVVRDITERKRAEETLAVERNLLRAVIDLLPDCIYAKDTSHRFLLSNEACALLMGAAAPAELIGKTDADFYPSELVANFRTEELSVFKGVPLINKAEPATRPDGTREFILTTKVPLKDGSGKTIGLVGCARFITERKQAEESLQQERNLLRTLMDHIPDYIYVRDISNRFIVANESFARLMGVPRPAALIGKRDADFYPAEMASSFDKIDQEVFAGRLILNRERVLLFPNGQELVVLNTKVPFRNDKGEVIGLIGIGRDITERKRAEEALNYERDLLRTLLDNSPDNIYFKDTQSRFVKASKLLARQFGVASPDEMEGKTDFDFFDEAHARPAFEDEQEVIRTGLPMIAKEEREVWKDEHVTWVSSTKMPWFDSAGKIIGIIGISRDITPQKLAEKQLRQLSSAVERSPVSIVITDRAGNIEYVNPKFMAVSGYSLEEVIGKNSRILKSGGTPDAEYKLMWQTILSGREWRGEFHNRKKNGELYWESASISFILDDAGKISHFVAVKEDITERKRAEESLRQFQFATDHAADAIFWTKRDASFCYVNDHACRSLGYTREELMRLNLFDIDPAYSQQRWEKVWRQREQNPIATRHFEGVHRRKDGSTFPIEVVSQNFSFGGVNISVAFVRDITERKRARQQLDEALNFNRAIISDAAVGITVFKTSGQCVLANETAARIVKATVSQLLAQDFRQIASWRASGMIQIAEEVLATKEPRRCELHFVSSFGADVWLESSFSHFIQNGEPHVIHAFVDLTEKKKIEAQLLRSQRMESIGTLAGGIAHDLNNVLAPLLISVELLKEKVSDDAGRRLLESLEANVNRGASLVKQVLTFGRGIKGERITIHLKHIGDGIARMIRETFPKSLKFEIQCASGLWTVTGDPTQLEQVLMNLCVNARDAMPGGGTLSLRMENRVLDKNHTTVNLEAKPGNYVVISVSDTGTGMAPEIQDRIFEPFFTTKEQGKGTGLGLSTALAIVKSHGGFVNYYSEVGKGSVFRVYLPASPDAANVKPAAANQSRLPHGNNELVLVVDDEEPIRILAKSMLERFGYRVLPAANGTEAVKLYTSHRNEIAAVITDMSMPGMDGPATIAALRAINPEVKVIGSSGRDVRDSATGVFNAGLVHFMSKPYTAETVLNMLHKVLRENPAK
jgi:PAS domain S-box-containing protein